jgi:RNA polymerase sigma-70 factor (ECF subfamily)
MNADLPLVEAILRGEEGAMQEVYSRYANEVWAFLRHYLRDPGLCDEIRDDVFVDVWRSAANYRAQGSLKSWIFGIARHRALDALAGGGKSVPLKDELLIPHGSDPEQDALRLESMERLERALQALDEEHRAVLLMAFVGDLSYADIGQALSCPEGTVKTRVHYARKKLRELMPERSHA